MPNIKKKIRDRFKLLQGVFKGSVLETSYF